MSSHDTFPPTKLDDGRFDIVLFGATGYTGRRCAQYLRRHVPDGVRWAIAGRSLDRLEKVRRQLGAEYAEQVGLIVADVDRHDTIDAMVDKARVIATTVGPYALYGSYLVESCVKQGVDYVDITGETPWVRDMIDTWQGAAADRGVRIIPLCGFDSVPSDLGTLFIASHAREHWNTGLKRVHAMFDVKGGLSGGTVASVLNIGESGRSRELGDPVLLNPSAQRTHDARARSPDQRGPVYDTDFGTWTAPLFMAPVDTRVVRRSHALSAEFGEGYGPGFVYSETARATGRWDAIKASLFMWMIAFLSARPWGRSLIRKRTPAPGEGPSPTELSKGYFIAKMVAWTEDGKRLTASVSAKGDPGYQATVMFLCEAALLLSTRRESLPGGTGRGGVLTPAIGLGMPYVARLQERGVKFTIDKLS